MAPLRLVPRLARWENVDRRIERVTKGFDAMDRNALYLIIAILAVAGGVMGYQLYSERHQSDRVEIDLGKNGLSILKK